MKRVVLSRRLNHYIGAGFLGESHLRFGRIHPTRIRAKLHYLVGFAAILFLLVGCGGPAVVPTTVPPTTAPSPDPKPRPTEVPAQGLSEEEIATLSSLEKVDDYPLYMMHYYGAYFQEVASVGDIGRTSYLGRPISDETIPACSWACSLFAALGDAEHLLYGRNFDWEYSPALLLFTDPPDGYASVSMVDIAYLGFAGTRAATLLDLSLDERLALLGAPYIPFDGMNERGLVVGMAAVPSGPAIPDPGEKTIGSVEVIRQMLDHASNVDEAVAILESYHIDWEGGPPIHYLIADASGQAMLVEFHEGRIVVFPNEASWHLATNFLRATVGDTTTGYCWRYDRILQQLERSQGQLSAEEAMQLLEQVAQESTQWSVVYEISRRYLHVTIGQQYNRPYTFRLVSSGE